ncbi:hypothetical protein FOA52_012208 [Chlamydomonas sp. UWO 241]|nr:hypothetical protein FOA52_012208 [Chlamydomonas sp. UWO 241]
MVSAAGALQQRATGVAVDAYGHAEWSANTSAGWGRARGGAYPHSYTATAEEVTWLNPVDPPVLLGAAHLNLVVRPVAEQPPAVPGAPPLLQAGAQLGGAGGARAREGGAAGGALASGSGGSSSGGGGGSGGSGGGARALGGPGLEGLLPVHLALPRRGPTRGTCGSGGGGGGDGAPEKHAARRSLGGNEGAAAGGGDEGAAAGGGDEGAAAGGGDGDADAGAAAQQQAGVGADVARVPSPGGGASASASASGASNLPGGASTPTGAAASEQLSLAELAGLYTGWLGARNMGDEVRV